MVNFIPAPPPHPLDLKFSVFHGKPCLLNKLVILYANFWIITKAFFFFPGKCRIYANLYKNNN